MSGNTIMRGDVVDNDFQAAYIMGVKSLGRHRVALRLETFRVTDLDNRSFDYNGEDGNSQTLGYSYLFDNRWKFSIEAVRFSSDHQARLHFGEETTQTEKQLTASLRYHL